MHHAMKTYGGIGGVATRILNLAVALQSDGFMN